MHIVIYKCACLVIRLCDINHLEKTMTQIPKWTGGPGPDDRDPESSRHYFPPLFPTFNTFYTKPPHGNRDPESEPEKQRFHTRPK